MFLKEDDPMGLGMGDEERSVDTPWLTGDQAQDHRHQLPVLGTFPWEVASCLGCWVSWVWSWWHGWELSATVWAHPLLPWGSARVWDVPLLVAGASGRAGGTGGDCTDMFSVHLPQNCF